MRFQAPLSTYPHDEQRKKREQKERNSYYYSFTLLNPEGTDHVLLKGDILTSYEQYFVPANTASSLIQNICKNMLPLRRGKSLFSKLFYSCFFSN